MKDYKELELKIRKIIVDIKIPQEIKDKLSNYYKKYNDACDSYISRIRLEESEEYTYRLKKYIESNFESGIETINATLDLEYALKKDKLSEVINELQYITEKKDRGLNIILFDREQDEKEYNQNIDKYRLDKIINDRSNNEEFIKNVRKIIVSELSSSKRNILQKSNLVNSRTKSRFEEDVEAIIKEVETDFSEIGKALTVQDQRIYDLVIEEIEQYTQENQDKENNTFEKQKKEFVERIDARGTVSEERARQTVEEIDEEITKENNNSSLDIDLF